ncbi:FecR family protein [uncultured Chryseobacterium sp.]|uniref:FecR family protein n=1 Tax=uncultured Chryseobacterium sp. TaxID=259322 RepID=UPI0025E8D49A|nr:FecR family protein [uncultured Chryseobacterium sp.]
MNQFEKDWDTVKKENRRIDAETDRRIWQNIARMTSGRKTKQQKMYWAAAILIPLLGLIGLFQLFSGHHTNAENILVLKTGNEMKTYRLSDGSFITMQPYSRLTIDRNNFGKKERSVEFEGKAFFDIAKDKTRPFRIDAQGFKVQVLGTRFFLDQKSADKSVALKEGKVKIERRGKITYLLPEETWVSDADDREHHYYSPSRVKTFAFNGQDYGEVIRLLEETYDVEIQYPVQYSKEKIQGSFTGNLKDVITIVSYPFSLTTVKIIDKQIVLK